jgi:hypothetical protein
MWPDKPTRRAINASPAEEMRVDSAGVVTMNFAESSAVPLPWMHSPPFRPEARIHFTAVAKT